MRPARVRGKCPGADGISREFEHKANDSSLELPKESKQAVQDKAESRSMEQDKLVPVSNEAAQGQPESKSTTSRDFSQGHGSLSKGDEVVVALATARDKLRAMREAQDADRKARRAAVGDVVKGKPEAQPAKRHRKAGANPAKPAKRPGFDRPKGRSRKSQKADERTSCSQLVPKP